VGADDDRKVQAGLLLLGASSGHLETVRAYPSNADAWEALWLSDEAVESAVEPELLELSITKD
jgi:hypothetical protein